MYEYDELNFAVIKESVMPDVSKCLNEDCTIKHLCYRYTVEPCEYQVYGEFEQVDGECEYFIEL